MSKEQDKDVTIDNDGGGKRRDNQADDDLKAQLKEVNDKLANITSAKDRQAEDLTRKYQKEKKLKGYSEDSIFEGGCIAC